MAQIRPQTLNKPGVSNCANFQGWTGKNLMPAAAAANDQLLLVEVPAGTEVTRVVINYPDFGAGITASIGFVVDDPDLNPNANLSLTSVAASGTLGANAGVVAYDLVPAVYVDAQAWLCLNFPGAVSGATPGVVNARVEGLNTGPSGKV